MITRDTLFQSKMARDFLAGKLSGVIKKRFKDCCCYLREFVTLWTRVLKLFFKVFVLQFKLAILTQKRRVLLTIEFRGLKDEPSGIAFNN